MKRLLTICVILVGVALASFYATLQHYGRLTEETGQRAPAREPLSEEPAVIVPVETFAPLKGDVFTLNALDFHERTRFAVNRFRREPREPLLTVSAHDTAVAQVDFPGREGRYRIWADCFLRKGGVGRLTALVDEDPVGSVELSGSENRWARVTLADVVDIPQRAAFALKAERTGTHSTLIGRITFEWLGDISTTGRAVKLLRGPMVQWVTETSAYIVWETNAVSIARVEFGSADRYGTSVESNRPSRYHAIKLEGLAAGTEYFYRIANDGVRLEKKSSFSTNKPAGAPFRFIVFGDSGVGSAAQRRVAAQMEKVKADFIVHTGDLIYGAGERMNYPLGFFEPYGRMIQSIGFYPSLGNHDYGTQNGQPFLDTFVLPDNGPPTLSPERNYWFTYGDALFVAVDSNAPDWRLRSDIGPWLTETLTNSDKKWKFVFFHHPPYSPGHRPETDPDGTRVRRTLVPIFERTRPTIVFVGHDHLYARLREIGGIRYIVSGGGGAPLYDKRYEYGFNEVLEEKKHSFTQVDIAGNRLSLTQIGDDGKKVDSFKISLAADGRN